MIPSPKCLQCLLAAAAPVLIVTLIPAVRENRGPATASALPPALPTDQGPAPFVLPELTADQVVAQNYLTTAEEPSAVLTPFLRPEREAEVVIESTDTVQADERPKASLSSIMSGGRPIAIVNGKAMTIGDSLAGDWIIVEIDAADGSVKFEHRFETDRHFTARLQRDLPGG